MLVGDSITIQVRVGLGLGSNPDPGTSPNPYPNANPNPSPNPDPNPNPVQMYIAIVMLLEGFGGFGPRATDDLGWDRVERAIHEKAAAVCGGSVMPHPGLEP